MFNDYIFMSTVLDNYFLFHRGYMENAMSHGSTSLTNVQPIS